MKNYVVAFERAVLVSGVVTMHIQSGKETQVEIVAAESKAEAMASVCNSNYVHTFRGVWRLKKGEKLKKGKLELPASEWPSLSRVGEIKELKKGN